jgi:HEAT repeat protein
VFLGLILLGGMALAVVEAVSPSSPSPSEARVDAPPPPAAKDEPGGPGAGVDPRASRGETASLVREPAVAPAVEAATAPLAIDRDRLARSAEAELARLLESPAPGLRRLAAMALARRGEARALAALRELAGAEPSPAARLEAAYGLARAGDAHGVDLLRAALTSRRRDERVEAARRLAELGDDAGRGSLESMLHVRSQRLAAAALLARLGDEPALAILREARSDSAAETRMRATVYLGLAGDDAVRPDLIAILADGRFGVGAAEALAVLGETAAVPALTEHLTRPSLQVSAAISLRRLGADVDLAPLAHALVGSQGHTQVTAAEAILILTDPAAPAELR